MRSARAGNLGNVGKNRRPLTEVELELARVKKELLRTLPRSRCPVRDDGGDATHLLTTNAL